MTSIVRRLVEFFYTYTFPEALLDKIVRSVHFEEAVWTQSGKTRTSEFTDILLAAVAKNSASAKDDARVIVRCETELRFVMSLKNLPAATNRSSENTSNLSEVSEQI